MPEVTEINFFPNFYKCVLDNFGLYILMDYDKHVQMKISVCSLYATDTCMGFTKFISLKY